MKLPPITPGPWSAVSLQYCDRVVKDGGNILAEVHSYASSKPDKEDRVANARAIAQVPAMLAALVEARGWVWGEERRKRIDAVLLAAGCELEEATEVVVVPQFQGADDFLPTGEAIVERKKHKPPPYRTQLEQNLTWSVYLGEGFMRGDYRTQEEAQAWIDKTLQEQREAEL